MGRKWAFMIRVLFLTLNIVPWVRKQRIIKQYPEDKVKQVDIFIESAWGGSVTKVRGEFTGDLFGDLGYGLNLRIFVHPLHPALELITVDAQGVGTGIRADLGCEVMSPSRSQRGGAI